MPLNQTEIEARAERVWLRLLLRLARENPALHEYATGQDYLDFADFTESALRTAREPKAGPSRASAAAPAPARVDPDLALYNAIKALHTKDGKTREGVWAPITLQVPGQPDLHGEGAWFQSGDPKNLIGYPRFRTLEQRGPHSSIWRVVEWNNIRRAFVLVESINKNGRK